MANNQIVVPHLYLDTNVFAYILGGSRRQQQRASVNLLETAKEKIWRCSTSIFTLMELSEIRKEHKYLFNQIEAGIPIRDAFRLLGQKDLGKDDLRYAQDTIDSLFRDSYSFVKFFSLEKAGWDRALELCATTNISPSDCIHLATAIEAGCDILVTLDSFFKGQAKQHMPSCEPQEVSKTLESLGFSL